MSQYTQVVATEAVPISEDMTRPRRDSEISAWVNIIYGCNERCTYCVVPTTRGVEQSRPRDSIRKEMEALAAQGYREVTLLGQNIDAWGRDMEPKQRFADLLHYVADVPGIERVRYVTSHPRYMSLSVSVACVACPRFMSLHGTCYMSLSVRNDIYIPPQTPLRRGWLCTQEVARNFCVYTQEVAHDFCLCTQEVARIFSVYTQEVACNVSVCIRRRWPVTLVCVCTGGGP
jgi:hypothetical protein